MKREKSVDLRIQRDEALYEAYKKALEKGTFNSQREIYLWLANCPAPCFYISWEFCYIVISRMLKGKPMKVSGQGRIRKFNKLFELFNIVRNTPGNEKLTTKGICQMIVNMPAPEFYISNRTFNMIIMDQKSKQCNKFIKRWVK